MGSELFFAYEFVKLGFCVSLIPDNSSEWKINGQNIPSPDFTVQKDSMKFLVEVARIKGDETILDISNRINSLIKEHPFRIDINYSEQFSISFVSNPFAEKEINRIELQEILPWKPIMP